MRHWASCWIVLIRRMINVPKRILCIILIKTYDDDNDADDGAMLLGNIDASKCNSNTHTHTHSATKKLPENLCIVRAAPNRKNLVSMKLLNHKATMKRYICLHNGILPFYAVQITTTRSRPLLLSVCACLYSALCTSFSVLNSNATKLLIWSLLCTHDRNRWQFSGVKVHITILLLHDYYLLCTYLHASHLYSLTHTRTQLIAFIWRTSTYCAIVT